MFRMSLTRPSQFEIPAAIDREMTPAVRDFFQRMTAFWQARVNECEARVTEFEREVKQLRGPHHQEPGNPDPKSDAEPAASKGSNAADPPKRRRGAQPGDPKSVRPLIPAAQCHEVHELVPEACRKCGESLAGTDRRPKMMLSQPRLSEMHRRSPRKCHLRVAPPSR